MVEYDRIIQDMYLCAEINFIEDSNRLAKKFIRTKCTARVIDVCIDVNRKLRDITDNVFSQKLDIILIIFLYYCRNEC